MAGETYLKNLIRENLDQVRLLRAQPEVNEQAMDDVLWHVLGLALELDELYAEQIREIDERDVVTIKEEFFKRQEMVELSKRREEAFGVFNLNNPDEKNLSELFEDMRKQTRYETAFYKSDQELVNDQLEARKEADERVNELNAERIDIENQIAFIRNNMVSFEEFSAGLIGDYERFVVENEIDQIDKDAVWTDILRLSERQMVIDRNRELARTATGIDFPDYIKSPDEPFDNDFALHEANEKLFLCELRDMFETEANTYDELLEKTKKIHAYVEEREQASGAIYDIERRNKISYRTMAFAVDVKNVEFQLNAKDNIAKLEERLNEIDLAIENAYNNVKGRKQLDDIINNRRGEYEEDEEILDDEVPVVGTEDMEPEVLGEEVNEQEKPEIEEIKEDEPLAEDEFEVINKENAKPGLLQRMKNKIKPILEKINNKIKNQFEVIKKSKPKPVLLKTVNENYKDKLAKIGKIAIPIILTGAILANAQLYFDKQNDKVVPATEPITVEEPADLTPNVIEDELEVVEQVYSPTVGDKVHISDGVKYYRDSSTAQLEQHSYETGKSGLKEGDYNVNRIALLAKDANGQPTGKMIEVNTTPGVSAEALAEALGLPEGNYDVIMHISRGDSHGNYIEASKDVKSPDDLCWIKTDGSYTNGISLTTSAEEVIKENIERGMSR